jgi:Taurine catabolism dioxygenase TauD, TfdA family
MSAKAIEPVSGRCAWKATTMRNDPPWIWPLPAQGLTDIDAALADVERRGLKPPAITKADFPLPHIAGDLARLAEELEEGRGFLVVRGLPVERYSYDQLCTIFWGLGLHFGRPVQQTKHGEWFIDVRDEGGAHNQNMRGYHSPSALPFHSDGGNDVVLLCINKAGAGGLSSLVSAAAVHNALLASHPEYMAPLYEGFPHDRRGAEPDGEPRISPWKLPVFSVTNGRFNCVFDRRSSEWGRERLGQPMTALEIAALDALDALTRDPEYRLDMDLQPGDMQFVNNFTVLHSRTAFVDDAEDGKRRHLVRLWLEAPQSQRRVLNKLHLYTRAPLPEGLHPVKSAA